MFEETKGREIKPVSNGTGMAEVVVKSPHLQVQPDSSSGCKAALGSNSLVLPILVGALKAELTYAGTAYPRPAPASMPDLAFGNFLLRVPEDLFDLLLESCKGIHFWTEAQ